MSAREPNPWDLLAGTVAPPPWHGEVHVHRMLDDDERLEDAAQAAAIATGRVCTKCGHAFPATPEYFFRSKHKRDGFRGECKRCHYEFPSLAKVQRRAASAKPTRQQLQELDDLAERAAEAILLVLPPWTLLIPGSDKEALARQVWSGLWWPFPAPPRPSREV